MQEGRGEREEGSGRRGEGGGEREEGRGRRGEGGMAGERSRGRREGEGNQRTIVNNTYLINNN